MRYWSEKDVAFLTDNYSVMPTREIANTLGRSFLAIWKKAHSLGLVLTDEAKYANKSLSRSGILVKGGRKKNYKGYVLVLNKTHPRADRNGYVFEHIVIAERKLGRLIGRYEVVHHINEIKDDNRPENLLVLSNAEHTKLHNLSRRTI